MLNCFYQGVCVQELSGPNADVVCHSTFSFSCTHLLNLYVPHFLLSIAVVIWDTIVGGIEVAEKLDGVKDKQRGKAKELLSFILFVSS